MATLLNSDKTGALVRKCTFYMRSACSVSASESLTYTLISDCPELKDYPDKYIYEPFKAPLDVQKKAKCVIGVDYPAPMLDEKEEKARCMARCKAAYKVRCVALSFAVQL